MANKVLFILKRREDYCAFSHSNRMLSTGLYNSARLVQEMLVDSGIDAEIEVAVDNNCIDRLVTQHRPTHVIIEALWVVPEKFVVLQRLHPGVKWIIRMHSETPFIANEGIAMDWLLEYSGFKNVYLGINAPRFLDEIRAMVSIRNRWDKHTAAERVFYMPNFYPTDDFVTKPLDREKDHIDIGCFGAIRPLKNHLEQAIAAVRFAEDHSKMLRFHVNDGRIEMKGQPVVNNLKGLFEQLHERGHEMIVHDWMPHDAFLKVCASMDLGLQVSFTETFNIVGADIVSQGVPLIASTEIPWAAPGFCADPTNNRNIVKKLERAWSWPGMNTWQNQRNIKNYSSNTRKIWVKLFKD